MSSAVSQSQKPALQGVKNKQRKAAKVVKHDPGSFQNSLLSPIIEAGDSIIGDFDKYLKIIEEQSNNLDFKRYSETLCELLIIGGQLVPGGILTEDGLNPMCLFETDEKLETVRKHVEVFEKLKRRLKYLERAMENSLPHILQHINNWTELQNLKLETYIGISCACQSLPLSILSCLNKDYLVKEGASLRFITQVFKVYLQEQNIEHFTNNLKKSKLDGNLLLFFPQNKRSDEYLSRHFIAEGLQQIVDIHKNKILEDSRKLTIKTLETMYEDEEKPQEIVGYLKNQMVANKGWTESDVVKCIWDAIDFGNKTDQMESQIKRQLEYWSPILEVFTTSPKTEINLLCKVQKTCYEDVKLMKFFRHTIYCLYQGDVLSEAAILYWSEKAMLPQGKSVFTKQMAPFIEWLKTADEDDSDEE
ncbi:ARM repeat-containing protein [Anaeromyces robustus]|uniref:ARM repeat-containing protein n=1 Tax=Anaeromyces robustus TaxID=1754192 RepID=A0A1Y1WVI5_9FUNG|nr:ARM repeat-containing protein [Anaeromyces robustus]|eukprot:ORX77472.1 ARM repeat-containing protein [Anaeromyces robustus]